MRDPNYYHNWYINNKEAHQAKGKIYKAQHKEEIDAYQKMYREKNREKKQAYSKVWWEENKAERNPARREKTKLYMRERRKTPEGQQYEKELRKRRKETGYWDRYYESHPEKSAERQRRYMKTEKGKIKNKRARDKRRKLGFEIIKENIIDEEIDWHHIDDEHVIAIPKDFHELYGSGKDNLSHRENLKPIINQIYDLSL